MESLAVGAEEAFPGIPVARSDSVLTGFRPALCVNPLTECRRWILCSNRLQLLPVPLVAVPSNREVHGGSRYCVRPATAPVSNAQRTNRACVFGSLTDAVTGVWGRACQSHAEALEAAGLRE
jgi:hypothetical protein